MQRLHVGVLTLTASATLGSPSPQLPAIGDHLALFFCGSAGNQQFSIGAQPGPLLDHILVVGSTGPPLVWDIEGPSNSTGTRVHVWGAYNPVHPSQLWQYSAPAQQLTSLYNGLCLEAATAEVSAPITQQTCNSTNPLQRFSYDAANSTFMFASSPESGLCIQAGNTSLSCQSPPLSSYPYCNPALSVQERVADLIPRLTLAEKAAALDSGVPAIGRLGLPDMHSGEGLHGVVGGCFSAAVAGPNSTGCATSFPCPMALGAAFDTRLWGSIGKAIGMEARAFNNQQQGSLMLFMPNINPGRDPRWGRLQEVPSEDAEVTSQYGIAMIRGVQGEGGMYLLAAATAKHFVAYDLEGYWPRTDPLPRPASAVCDTPGGCQRWNFDAFPPQRDMTAYYLAPFDGAVRAAGVRSIMCAYSAIQGKPSCGSPEYLTDVLRTQWGWDGHVVSDCTAIELMQDAKWDGCPPPYPPTSCIPDSFPGHNFTGTVAETANAALASGVDVNCGPFYRMWLEGLVRNGSVAEGLLDVAAGRVYTTALMLGLADDPADQPYAQLPPSTVDSAEHRALSLTAARESIVLLKNTAKLLPLAPGKRLALIGPHANSTQALLSSYHGDNTLVDSHSPLAAAIARGLLVTYAKGCNICDVVPPGFPNMPCPPGKANDTSGLADAVTAASSADIAIVFVGADQTTEAENFDRDSIGLSGQQEALVQAVVAAQPNTVVVLISGGVVSSPWVVQHAGGLMQAFYGGQLGGEAIVDVLTGSFAPSGALPVTYYFPNFTARDIREMDLAAAGGATHSFFTGPVLFPFGYTLSYTTYSYRWGAVGVRESGARGTPGDQPLLLLSAAGEAHAASGAPTALILPVEVVNTGAVASDRVLLLFAVATEEQALANSTPGDPMRRQTLLAFTRLQGVAPGETRMHEFEVHLSRLPAFASACESTGNMPRAEGPVPAPWRLRVGAPSPVTGEVDAEPLWLDAWVQCGGGRE